MRSIQDDKREDEKREKWMRDLRYAFSPKRFVLCIWSHLVGILQTVNFRL